ncbi:hypothetical protein SDC9_68353 [bioreactor metagenome]|uniref:Uncharacterized protein n=1 Tax=bioreactor metagenome TaxID=1076179 RepID=A0A644Y5R9_9ZZZZ
MSEKTIRLVRFVHNVLLVTYAALTCWGWLRCDWAFGKSPPPVDAPVLPATLFGALMLAIWGSAAFLRGLLVYQSLNRWLASFALWPLLILIIFFLLPAKLGINPLDLPHILTTIPIIIGVMLAAAFYTPMIGLFRIVPALRIRAASTFFDPVLAVLTGLIYLAVSVICYSLGRRAKDMPALVVHDDLAQ